MRIDQFTFGSIRIDGVIYDHDVVIDRGRVREWPTRTPRPIISSARTRGAPRFLWKPH
jgi:hypothetical protein